MLSQTRRQLERLLHRLPEESLPQVLEFVERLSHPSRKQMKARPSRRDGRKRHLNRLNLPANPETAEAVLREEVGFGILPAPLKLVQQVMEEDLYGLEGPE